MCQEALDLKRSNGGEGQSKCRKDKKIMICGMGLDLLQCSDEFHMLSVALEWTGTESSSESSDYRCTQCQETAHLLDSRPHREVQVGPDKPEMVASFY